MKKHVLVAGLVMGFLCDGFVASAHGATLTYNDTHYGQTNWGFNPVVNLEIQKFNPSFGTLLSVKVEVQGYLYFNGNVESYTNNNTITYTSPDPAQQSNSIAVSLPTGMPSPLGVCPRIT